MIYLAIAAIYFLFIRFLVVFVNFLTRPYLRNYHLQDKPLVSVLIPARNEEKKLPLLLQDIVDQSYDNLEIIVYNDESTDNTERILQQWQKNDHRLNYLNGQPLPEGWMGKNHACHRLAQAAKGDYFIFLDADVRIQKNLILKALSHSQKHRLALLSIFPKQTMKTFGEKTVIPVMNWILLSLLPLFLVKRCRWASFSAANGQFMLFHRESYLRKQWHKTAKDQLAEDIFILRKMKKHRYKVQTLVSRGEINCRMYHDYKEAVNGFSKNIFAMFGNSWIFLLIFILFSATGWIPVVLSLHFFWWIFYFSLILLIIVLISTILRENLFLNIAMGLAKYTAFIHIVITAVKNRKNRIYIWKNRNIKLN